MQQLHIEKGPNTPRIDFDGNLSILKIEGRSIPENPSEFYQPLFDWVHEYYKQPRSLTQLIIKLEYINSGSSKSMLEFLRIIKDNHFAGNKCIVKWYYEFDDEAVQELGEHYSHTLKIPFEFVSY
jgi:hypothetical protein